MFRRIVLAIDTSPASETALSFAIAIATSSPDSDPTVHIVFVNELLVGAKGVTLLTAAEATELVSNAISQLHQAGIDATGSVHVASYAKVSDVIARAAEDRGADAIILGSRRNRRTKRLFSRGIREKTTRLTALPVLTSPSPLDLSTLDLSAELLGNGPAAVTEPMAIGPG